MSTTLGYFVFWRQHALGNMHTTLESAELHMRDSTYSTNMVIYALVQSSGYATLVAVREK